MKKTKMARTTGIMIAFGLLLTSGVPLLARYTHIPDFARGGLSGFGIGIMIVALVWQRRKSACIPDKDQLAG